MLSYSKAFQIVLDQYIEEGGSASALGNESGVQDSAISKFRRGTQQVNTDTLEKLIHAFPKHLRAEFFRQVQYGGSHDGEPISLLDQVAQMLGDVTPEEYLGFALSVLYRVFLYAQAKAETNGQFYLSAVDQLIANVPEDDLPKILEIFAARFSRAKSASKGERKD